MEAGGLEASVIFSYTESLRQARDTWNCPVNKQTNKINKRKKWDVPIPVHVCYKPNSELHFSLFGFWAAATTSEWQRTGAGESRRRYSVHSLRRSSKCDSSVMLHRGTTGKVLGIRTQGHTAWPQGGGGGCVKWALPICRKMKVAFRKLQLIIGGGYSKNCLAKLTSTAWILLPRAWLREWERMDGRMDE